LIDFVKIVLKKTMVGFEPSSPYSKEGTDRLKLKIVEDFFSPEYLANSKIDFAICFQVIQLVDDPHLFLQQVCKVLGSRGVLLLSTPDGDSLSERSGSPGDVTLLSPGVHKIIFSKKALQIALSKAGFSNTIIIKREEQLYALASQNEIQEIDLFRSSRAIVLNYYLNRLSSFEKNSAYFKGIWYRYYRNRIDHGEYAEALDSLKEVNWFEIWNEKEIEDIRSSDKLLELNSSADAIIYYYTGILFLNHLQKLGYAEKFFHLAFLLCKKIIQFRPDSCMIEQDIIWEAKLHFILTRIKLGDTDEAKAELIKMIASNEIDNDYLPKPGARLILKTETVLKEIS
jgi:SAM-dependent methyltransferase